LHSPVRQRRVGDPEAFKLRFSALRQCARIAASTPLLVIGAMMSQRRLSVVSRERIDHGCGRIGIKSCPTVDTLPTGK